MKSLGYLITIIGLAGFLLNYEAVRKIANITIPESILGSTLLIGSLVVLAIGLFIVIKSPKKGKKDKQQAEVPIYHGEKVVGYRRT